MCLGALVANKADLKERRVVGVAEGRSFAQSKDLQFFECSAVSHRPSYCFYLMDPFLLLS